MGKVVTFYSYKGGTGRTMALANVAWVLASNGARVLVVDWDLEAPGLHRYFRPFLSDKDLVRMESQGILDWVADFVAQLATPESGNTTRGDQWYRERADVSKWSKRLLWPSGEDARTAAGGTVEFIPAGRQGPQYATRMNSFDWTAFYERCNGGAFIDAMRRSMTVYDWVLIDSRTGVSDTSGICTIQLPDILVVCFTLNYQSIEGASAVARSAQAMKKGAELRILPLPTRLDGNEEKQLKTMMAYAKRVFTPLMPAGLDVEKYWGEMGVPYFSRYAYAEKLATFEEQVNVSTSTLPAMERLTGYITDRAVTKLQPLPVAAKADVIEEFEALPEALGVDLPRDAVMPAPSQHGRPAWTSGLMSRLAYQFRSSPWLTASASVAVAAALSWGISRLRSTPSDAVAETIPRVVDISNLANRDQQALVIAETATRLNPSTVVSAVSATAPVLDALLALQPFVMLNEQNATLAGPRTVQISPDGRWVAYAVLKNDAHIMRLPLEAQGSDRATGYPTQTSTFDRRYGGPLNGYSVAAFSPDSRYAATGGRNGSLIIYDLATGARVWQWENKDPDSAWVTAIAFSPNGNLVAAGTDTGEVVIAKVEAWTELRTFRPIKPETNITPDIGALAFSPDSVYLAVAGGTSSVRLLTYQREAPVELFGPHKGVVRAMVFLSGSDAAAGDPSPRSSPVGRPTTSIRSPLKMATTSGDGVVHIWTQTADRPLHTQFNPGNNVTQLASTSEDGGWLATAGGTIRALRIREGEPISWPSISIDLTHGPARSLTFNRSGRWLVAASTGSIEVFDLRTGRLLTMNDFRREIYAVAVGPDSRYVAVAANDGLYLSMLQLADRPLTLAASEVQTLACSQTRQTVLQAEIWKAFFGSDPVRFTCGERNRGSLAQ